jgi:hypothetical protein
VPIPFSERHRIELSPHCRSLTASLMMERDPVILITAIASMTQDIFCRHNEGAQRRIQAFNARLYQWRRLLKRSQASRETDAALQSRDVWALVEEQQNQLELLSKQKEVFSAEVAAWRQRAEFAEAAWQSIQSTRAMKVVNYYWRLRRRLVGH